MKYRSRNKCLCCKEKKLSEIINLGLHSFADRFIPLNKSNQKDPMYPLILDICRKCSFIQSRIITNPKHRYIDLDYSYTSNNSEYSRNHWTKLADMLDKKFNIKKKKIIEIGSNDGFLSSILKEKGADVLAVDASKFMVNICQKKKINSIHSIFDFSQSKKIKKKYGQADIIIANNVFNHSNEPSNFIKGVNNLLKNDGKFIFEQPNFTKGVLSLKFDQIYHEHISYFTVKNIDSMLRYNDFKVMSITKNDYHGGSLRTIATKKDFKIKSFNLTKLKNYEKKKNIYNINYYKKMMKKIDIKKTFLLKKINNYIKNGNVICGIGAGAKSNTFLTYYGLNSTRIKFITDSSKFKKNKLTPVSRILIKDDNELKKYDKIFCIILSWNISDLIKKKIKKINKKIEFIYT